MLIFGNIGNVVSAQKKPAPKLECVFCSQFAVSSGLMPRGLEKCFLGSIGQASDNPLGLFSKLFLVPHEN